MLKKAHLYNLKKLLKEAGLNIPYPLFHSTSSKHIESILTSGLKARAGGPKNDAYWGNAICLSRNLNFLLEDTNFGGAQVILVFSRDELKSRFKTHSYDYYHDRRPDSSGQDRFLNKKRLFEFEERVTDRPKSPKEIREIREKGELGDYCLPKETVIAPKYIKAVIITKSTYAKNMDLFDEIDQHTHVFVREGTRFSNLGSGYDALNLDSTHIDINKLVKFLTMQIYDLNRGRDYGDYTKFTLVSLDFEPSNTEREILERLEIISKEYSLPGQTPLFEKFSDELAKVYPDFTGLSLTALELSYQDYTEDGTGISSSSVNVYMEVDVDSEQADDFEEYISENLS